MKLPPSQPFGSYAALKRTFDEIMTAIDDAPGEESLAAVQVDYAKEINAFRILALSGKDDYAPTLFDRIRNALRTRTQQIAFEREYRYEIDCS